MGYIRKTVDVWEVQGNYGQGWECVTAEYTYREARERLHEYRENEPGTSFRLKLTRERRTIYKVHIGGRRHKRCTSLQDAEKFCSEVFNRTKIVLSIVAE